MVEKQFDKTQVTLIKNPYSLRSKLSGYIGKDDYTDKSKDKLYVLPSTKLIYYIDIFKYADGIEKFRIEMDGNSLLEVDDVSLDKIYEVVTEFSKQCNASELLLDVNYNVFAYSFSKDVFIPYLSEKIDKTEVSVNILAPIVDELFVNKESYLILAIGDTIKIVDSYTFHNLVFFLIKPYLEARFPVTDTKKLDKKRIITYQGFSFVYYHLKSLLHKKDTLYKETLKTGYDNMSKMNLLPYVPDEIWYTTDVVKNLKTERLRSFLKKKKSIFEKVAEVIRPTTVEKEKYNIPDYYREYFSDDFPVIYWKDFISGMEALDWGVEAYNNKFIEEIDDDIYVATPCIIIPDMPILDLNPQDIVFMGYDGSELKMSIKTQLDTEYESIEEQAFKEKIMKYLVTKYGIETKITYECIPGLPYQSKFDYDY